MTLLVILVVGTFAPFQCSLYPYVMSKMAFPAKAHPETLDGSLLADHGRGWDVDRVKQFFGVFSVCIMFVKTPFYPPIPFKTRDKSVFGCCRAVRVHLLKPFVETYNLSVWKRTNRANVTITRRWREVSKQSSTLVRH